eukprot:755060-Hanusia_phi.AAC.2
MRNPPVLNDDSEPLVPLCPCSPLGGQHQAMCTAKPSQAADGAERSLSMAMPVVRRIESRANRRTADSVIICR